MKRQLVLLLCLAAVVDHVVGDCINDCGRYKCKGTGECDCTRKSNGNKADGRRYAADCSVSGDCYFNRKTWGCDSHMESLNDIAGLVGSIIDEDVKAKDLHPSTAEVYNKVHREINLYPGLPVHNFVLLSGTNKDVDLNAYLRQLDIDTEYKGINSSISIPFEHQLDIQIFASFDEILEVDVVTEFDGRFVYMTAYAQKSAYAYNVQIGGAPHANATAYEPNSFETEEKYKNIRFGVGDGLDGSRQVMFYAIVLTGVFDTAYGNLKGVGFEMKTEMLLDDNVGKVVAPILLICLIAAIVGMCVGGFHKREKVKMHFDIWWGKRDNVITPEVVIAAQAAERNKEREKEDDPEIPEDYTQQIPYAQRRQIANGVAGITGYNAAKAVEGSDSDSEVDLTCTDYVIVISVRIMRLIADITRSLINLSLIHASFAIWAPSIIPLASLKDYISVPAVNLILFGLNDYLDSLARVTDTLLLWNCGGVIQIISPIILLAILVFIFTLLSRDALLLLTIRINKYKESMVIFRSRAGRMLFGMISAFVVGICFYLLQITIMSSSSLVVGMLSVRRTCSAQDFSLATFAFIANLFILVVSVFIIFFTFAGKPLRHFKKCGPCAIFPILFDGVSRVILLTFGIWTKRLCDSHDIIERAHKFDDDDEDDDNQHENVISVFGKSRGLIWVMIPACVVLSKVSETVSDPAIFVYGDYVYLKTPKWQRVKMWVSHIISLNLVVICAAYPTMQLFFAMIISHIPIHVYLMSVDLRRLRSGESLM